MSDIVALDLFAGTGWGVALQALGIDELGVELMPEAVATREAAGMGTIYRDVWEGLLDPVQLDALREWTRAGGTRGEFYQMLIASPPCQTFSMAGKGAGRAALDEVLVAIRHGLYQTPAELFGLTTKLDPRTALVLTPLAYVFRDAPEYVVLEQVPAVLPVWEAYAEVMREQMGYSVVTGILNAEQYGVPQTRRRAILIARRDGLPAGMPVSSHSRYYAREPQRLDSGVLPWVSMAEALGWGLSERPSPTITGGGTETGGAEPIAKLARYTARPDWTFRRPATTIMGGSDVCAGPGRSEFVKGGVSRQNRPGSIRLTVAEAAVLQTYPADFPFQGTKGKQFLQVGNAVPPLLGAAIISTALAGAMAVAA